MSQFFVQIDICYYAVNRANAIIGTAPLAQFVNGYEISIDSPSSYCRNKSTHYNDQVWYYLVASRIVFSSEYFIQYYF